MITRVAAAIFLILSGACFAQAGLMVQPDLVSQDDVAVMRMVTADQEVLAQGYLLEGRGETLAGCSNAENVTGSQPICSLGFWFDRSSGTSISLEEPLLSTADYLFSLLRPA